MNSQTETDLKFKLLYEMSNDLFEMNKELRKMIDLLNKKIDIVCEVLKLK